MVNYGRNILHEVTWKPSQNIFTTIYSILMIQVDQALHFNFHHVVFNPFTLAAPEDLTCFSPYNL